MKPERIKAIRASLDSGYDKVQVATVDAFELRDLLDTADEAARLRAENRRLVIANDQWRWDAIAHAQGHDPLAEMKKANAQLVNTVRELRDLVKSEGKA